MSSLEGYIFGRYRLHEAIGQGGMASVYKAHDTVDDRFVALKVLSPAMAQHSQFSQRFRREARVVMQLKHPHILPVLDVGEKDGYAYIVMPYMESGSLAERLLKGPLTPHEAGRLISQVAGALAYAHSNGIVHRDIKPPNIMLDAKGNAFLADFGLAHLHNTSISLTGSAIIGTPAYISPEQSLGRKVDARSDQYSLGIVLYQLATGKVPYNGETPIAILLKHVNEPIPNPRSINPSVPEPVENVILKSTAKEPDERFESIAEMNQVFQAALAYVIDPEKNPEPVIVLPLVPGEGDAEGSPPAEVEEPLTGRRRVARFAAIAALLLLLLLACPVASTGVINILNATSNPVEGRGLSEETMDPVELTELAGTIEALSTDAADPTGIATVLQTVVVTGDATATSTLEPSPTITVTGAITATARPTATSFFQPTNPPPAAPTKTPTKKPKPPTALPTNPPPTSTPVPTNPPPTNPPPTNPPPTNPPPTQPPTVPPYP